MKRALRIIIIALFVSIMAIPVQAQQRKVRFLANYENEPYHFGFLVAYNQMMYTIQTIENYQNMALPTTPNPWPNGAYDADHTPYLYVYNIETKQTPGFTVGIIGSKRLGRYFDLRFIPSLSFSDRQLNYTIATQNDEGVISIIPKIENKPIFTTFVEFPLNIKYRSKRYNNIGAYILAGINPKLDLASQKKNTIEIPVYDTDGNPVIGPDGQQEIEKIINNLVTKRFDFAGEIGVGFDIYNQWFKMGIEIKMSYGMLDIVKRSSDVSNTLIYTAPIDQLKNKMFQFSLIFE